LPIKLLGDLADTCPNQSIRLEGVLMGKSIWRKSAICVVTVSLLVAGVVRSASAADSNQETAKEPSKIDSEVFSGLNARAIGPAVTATGM
jgi:hypothetical protein